MDKNWNFLPLSFGYYCGDDHLGCSSVFYLLKTLIEFIFFFKLIFIGVWLIYNVVLVSAVQQSESVIHIHVSILF